MKVDYKKLAEKLFDDINAEHIKSATDVEMYLMRAIEPASSAMLCLFTVRLFDRDGIELAYQEYVDFCEMKDNVFAFRQTLDGGAYVPAESIIFPVPTKRKYSAVLDYISFTNGNKTLFVRVALPLVVSAHVAIDFDKVLFPVALFKSEKL